MSRRGVVRAAWLGAGLLGLALAVWLSTDGLRREVVEGLERLSWAAVAIALCGQLVSTVLCAAALRELAPGARYRAALGSRWVRDGVSNLLALVPGAGEAAGARVLAASGATAGLAVGATAADAVAETAAQVLYTALALAWAPVLLAPAPPSATTLARDAGGLAVLALAAALCLRPLRRWTARHAARTWRAGAVYAREVGPWRAAVALLLHLAAWLVGGLQLWAAARVMGFPLGVGQGVCLEALTYAGRGVLFFVPAGVGVQEAAMTSLAVAFGLDVQAGVALALLLRVRDALIGLPGLFVWVAIEARRSVQRRGLRAIA